MMAHLRFAKMGLQLTSQSVDQLLRSGRQPEGSPTRLASTGLATSCWIIRVLGRPGFLLWSL